MEIITYRAMFSMRPHASIAKQEEMKLQLHNQETNVARYCSHTKNHSNKGSEKTQIERNELCNLYIDPRYLLDRGLEKRVQSATKVK